MRARLQSRSVTLSDSISQHTCGALIIIVSESLWQTLAKLEAQLELDKDVKERKRMERALAKAKSDLEAKGV